MTDTELPDEAKAIAQAELTEGKFNFLDAVVGRDYPTEEVEIWLDEAAAYEIEKLEEELDRTKNGDKAVALAERLDDLRERAHKSRYVITLQAITVEEYDNVVTAALEQFPQEFIETRHPLTFALERTPKPSEERQQFFRTHLWAKFIRKVTGPTGGVDDDISPEWCAVFLSNAPLMALGRVEVAVDKLRMVSDWMDRLASDDFLAKS
jgi:hypothetical protein